MINFKNRFEFGPAGLLVLAAVLFLGYRFGVLFSIESERQMPIEVDDSFVYLSHAHLLYADLNRTKPTAESIKKTAELTLKDNSEGTVKNVLRYGNWAKNKGYFLYSTILGFFTQTLDLSPVSVLWFSYFIVQVLIFLSIVAFARLFLSPGSRSLLVVTVLCSFISLEIVHQITATPFTIASALMIIGWSGLVRPYWQGRASFVLSLLIVFMALHMHPGAFVVAGVLAFAFFCMAIYSRTFTDLIPVISLTGLVVSALVLELAITHLWNISSYLNVFSEATLGGGTKRLSFNELISYNLDETLKRFKDFTQYVSFSINDIGMYLYVGLAIISFLISKPLFFLNLSFFLCFTLGLLHYLPHYRGELIEYVGQPFSILVAITFVAIFSRTFEVFNIKHSQKILAVASVIYLALLAPNKFSDTQKQIEIRTDRHNIANSIDSVIRIVNESDKSAPILVGHEFAYVILLSQFSDRRIMLADHMRKQGHWSYPPYLKKPALYFGQSLERVSAGGTEHLLGETLHSDGTLIVAKVKYHQ